MSKDQINLPKTAFSMKANLPLKEPKIVEHWNKIDLYNLLRENNKGKEKFVLHDGPPYANGNIHMGTAFNKILKRYNYKISSNGWQRLSLCSWMGLPWFAH